ncbi:MAG: hypothetical protein ACE5HV_05445 [Acidobacteriota bacterium]
MLRHVQASAIHPEASLPRLRPAFPEMLTATFSLLVAHGAIGMLMAAALARSPTGPGFHRLTLLVSLAGLTLGFGLRIASRSSPLPPLGSVATVSFLLTLVAAVACGVRLLLAPARQHFGLLALAAIAGTVAVVSEPALRQWLPSTGGLAAGLYFIGLATVAPALGSVLFAMLLAHWYLVEPRLPLQPLQKVLWLFAGTEILKGLLLFGLLFVHLPEWSTSEGGLVSAFVMGDALFVAVRAVLGVLAPLGLAWMIWKTVQIRSIQSATGILYAALVFVLFGETISIYLSLATGQPY